jgi:hypothetical protein
MPRWEEEACWIGVAGIKGDGAEATIDGQPESCMGLHRRVRRLGAAARWLAGLISNECCI